jgi:hypothetical protein
MHATLCRLQQRLFTISSTLQLLNEETIWLRNLRPFVARLVSRLIRRRCADARCFTVVYPGYSVVFPSVWLQTEP